VHRPEFDVPVPIEKPSASGQKSTSSQKSLSLPLTHVEPNVVRSRFFAIPPPPTTETTHFSLR
jgi:hypothetical protein